MIKRFLRFLEKIGLIISCYRCGSKILKRKAIYGYACEDPHDLIRVPFCELCIEYLDIEGEIK